MANVTLLDGTVVDSWSPEWLAETRDRELEARMILRFATREIRRAHLAKREAEHGAEYRRRLEAVILEIHNRRNS